jgi:spermidine dehydrogenase
MSDVDPAPERGDRITRRDFLDGVAIGAAGLAAAAAAPHLTGAQAALAATGGERTPPPGPLPPGYDPGIEEGLKGQRDDVVGRIVQIDGPPSPGDVHSTAGGPGIALAGNRPTGETYDCVIVGAGASGLAAAKFYRDRFGPSARILLLDPLPDYGGHATRNEFTVPNGAAGGANLRLLRNGGAVNLDSIGTWDQPAGGLLDVPGAYGQPALDILEWAGVDPDAFPSSSTPGIPASFGLRQMLLFPQEDWGADSLEQTRRNATEPNTPAGWTAFMNRLPYGQDAKDAIVRIQTGTTDWMDAKDGPRTVEQKLTTLTQITYRQYLQRYLDAPDEAIVEYQRRTHSLLGAGVQVASAIDAWLLGLPGFQGVDLGDQEELAFPGMGRTPQMGVKSVTDPTIAWPDGNSSLMRLMVAKLIPQAVPDVGGARPDQETVVNARTDYAQLDQPGNTVRIRLRTLVVGVRAAKRRGDTAEVDYILMDDDRRGPARAYRVSARHVVMACWNRVTAQIVEGLPRPQVEGLCYARKVPLIYGRAALNNWQAFADARISNVAPRGNSLFWDTTSIAAGARFGSAYGPTPNSPPSAPAVLNFTVVPSDPARTPQLAAYEAGREKLLGMSFGDLEDALWDVLERSVNRSGGDFDPARDVDSIMINRWNYGYAHELTSVWDPSLAGPVSGQPQVIGRAPYRNVAIANSDSGAFAYAHSAFAEAARAVADLPENPIRR